MIRQAHTGDTVLVKSNEMTGRTQTLPWWLHCKKNLKNSCIFFYQTFQKRENPYAFKGIFGALQRRDFLSFEEGKVFLLLQG